MFKISYMSFHSSSFFYSINKNLLSKLRKMTGFSFSNCKEALDKFDNDIIKAELYLKDQAQKEGWTKATKLQGRPMSLGLIGIIFKNDAASIVEVNCETDFVSRNLKFKNFTTLVCSALHFHGLQLSKNRINYGSNEMSALYINGNKLSDLTVLEIGTLGENIIIRRGIFIKPLRAQHISYYIHETGPKIDSPSGSCCLGKYGALVVFSRKENFASPYDIPILTNDQIGRELSQHIVGMKPHCIDKEDLPNIKYQNSKSESNQHLQDTLIITKEAEKLDEIHHEGSMQHETKKIIEEDRLLKQEFIWNTEITVEQYLQQQGVHVIDFIRLECGEDLVNEKNQNFA